MTLLSLIQLLLIGIAIAAIVLGVAWYKNRSFSFHRLVLLTTFFTFDLILFGAFTRLTDSGLGCPDWPGCYGHASPVGAQAFISAAQEAMPTGPVTWHKAWIEMIHRYLAAAVGVLILTQALFVAWRAWQARRGKNDDGLASQTPATGVW